MKTPDDVRMRGFRTRSTVADALQWVDDESSRLQQSESVALDNAADRIVASDVTSPLHVPRFERAAMDGYAVVAEDTIGASPSCPVTLRVIEDSLPGAAAGCSVTSGSAIRIMTGGPVPAGATAVLPVESVRPSDMGDSLIDIVEAVPEGRHIAGIGEDVTQGRVICPSGTRLLPQHLGLLASVGLPAVEVVRRPRVRVIATGREIVAAGEPLGDTQIYDANTPALTALVQRDGGELEATCRVSDDRAAIDERLVQPDADVILVSGGSSVGAEDFAPVVLAERGELPIHGVAMRPSSPAGMGKIGDALVFLLPGNPVSCLCAYDFFAGRAIRRLGGRTAAWPYPAAERPLVRRIVSMVGRTDYCRVRLTEAGIEPIAISGASILSSITRADGFVVVPAALEGYAAGTMVTVWLYDQLTGTSVAVQAGRPAEW
jgi:molybdopterin molybdotransferase